MLRRNIFKEEDIEKKKNDIRRTKPIAYRFSEILFAWASIDINSPYLILCKLVVKIINNLISTATYHVLI